MNVQSTFDMNSSHIELSENRLEPTDNRLGTYKSYIILEIVSEYIL